MSRKIKRNFILAALLLGASGLISLLAGHASGLGEWYSTHIYPLIVGSVGRLFGVLPFSASEIGIYLLIVTVIATGIYTLVKILAKKSRPLSALYYLSGLFLTAAVLMTLYVFNCGINYRRISFSQISGIETGPYTFDELKEVCVWLTDEVNRRAFDVERNADGIMVLEAPEGKAAVAAMNRLGEIYPALAGYYPQPKGLIVSEILSYQKLSGIYSPFTVEANYNQDMTDYNIPFTACHELSHLRGFMQEEEANFIAFLACNVSERTDFQYSGYLLGWIYATNALYAADKDAWNEVCDSLEPQVYVDLTANNTFWKSYEGTVSKVSSKVNDTYLKANGQKDGVFSYNRLVDLLIVYYQSNTFSR